jgi:hypothetical protein
MEEPFLYILYFTPQSTRHFTSVLFSCPEKRCTII